MPVSASAPDHGDGSATVEPDDIGTETRAHVTARADLRRDVTLPVVEVSAGTGGSLSIKDLTLYHQAVSEDHFTSLFHRPPPKHPDEHPYALGLLRGESMVPRYFDRQLVPLELFEPSDDAPAGNVYLVRLDGHLHLKVLDRIPGRTHEGEIVPPTIILSSYHRSYMPMRVPLDGSIDFAVLGSVVETGQQKLYGALLAERFGFQ
ncbi:MAG: S24 family peptidase [Bacteroidota bacterium]